MRLTKEQIKALPNGSIVTLFYSGNDWKEDFGKVFTAMKKENRLYHITGFDDIDEIDDRDYEIIVAVPEKGTIRFYGCERKKL